MFADTASFLNCEFGAEAGFLGATFGKGVTFDRILAQGCIFFQPDENGTPVVFSGPARFLSARIGKQASFRGVQFCGDANFGRIHFEGAAFFGSMAHPGKVFSTCFEGTADFSSAFFDSDVQFEQVTFRRPVRFVGAHFTQNVRFHAQFEGKADFGSAVLERRASFQDSVFRNGAIFSDARAHVVLFRGALSDGVPPGENPQFEGRVDLRGFTYDRIVVAWRELFERLAPYDLQPYEQLEAAVRANGDEWTAGDVYLARKQREVRYLWMERRDWSRAAFWSLVGVIARYGVRPVRLIILALFVVSRGTWVFSYPDAVVHRETTREGRDHLYLGWVDAAGVSLKQFLPVEVAVGRQWVPTDRVFPFLEGSPIPFSFAAYATIHHLAGWVLVPLGVAALSGFLHRRRRA